MARIRSIKPEAFTSETLASVSVHARWTFAGLWTYVDDEGRGRANAGLIKAAVWPLDEDITPKHVGEFLDELEAASLVCRYEVDGKSYVHAVNFGEHQHPNRPLPSKLPACSRRTHGGLSESAVSPHNGPPAGGAEAGAASPEVSRGAESAKTGRTAGKGAGQGSLTDDAVSPHGARTAKSSSTPPTPTTYVTGDGEGNVDGEGVPPSAGAGKPRRAAKATPPSEAHIGTVVAAYVDGATEAGQPAPASSLKARVGREARQLLKDGYNVAVLVESAKRMGAGEWNDLAVQVRKDAAANGSVSGRPDMRGGARQKLLSHEDAPKLDPRRIV